MSRKNFRDPTTGQEFHITEFSSSLKDDQTIYKDRYRKELINEETGVKLEFIPRPKEDFGMPVVSSYNASSSSGQDNLVKHFGGRAKKFDTTGAGRDTKDQINGDFKKQILENAKDGKRI